MSAGDCWDNVDDRSQPKSYNGCANYQQCGVPSVPSAGSQGGFGRGRGVLKSNVDALAAISTGPSNGVPAVTTGGSSIVFGVGRGRGRGGVINGFSAGAAPSSLPQTLTASNLPCFAADGSGSIVSERNPGPTVTEKTGFHGGFAKSVVVPVPTKAEPLWLVQGDRDEKKEKELFGTANTGINFNLYDNIPVSVKGSNTPSPVQRFLEMRLHNFLQDNIKLCGYDIPTPVQRYGLPIALAGLDMMACAQTGSGKTAAYLIPIMQYILTKGPTESQFKSDRPLSGYSCQYPLALIMAPTRELSLQIYNEATKFSYRTCIKPRMMYGGKENYNDQLSALRRGCHLLIGTPGRITDVLKKGCLSLKNVKFFVLDEGDRMLDMGFIPQIREIVEYEMPSKGKRQTLMFSATFPSEIQQLARDFLVPDYVFLTVGRVGSTTENIEQQLVHITKGECEKEHQLIRLLNSFDKEQLTLIFVETKRAAADMAFALTKCNFPAVAIHGDLEQWQRELNLKEFRNGSKPILVATAVAARGLDIPNVKTVINYDIPGDIDEYVHRIGRTGRCGNKGLAISFFDPSRKDRFMASRVLNLLKETKQDIPKWLSDVAADPHSDYRFSKNNFRSGGGGFKGNSYRGGCPSFHHSSSSPSFGSGSSNSNNNSNSHDSWVPKDQYPSSSTASNYNSPAWKQGSSCTDSGSKANWW